MDIKQENVDLKRRNAELEEEFKTNQYLLASVIRSMRELLDFADKRYYQNKDVLTKGDYYGDN